MGITVAVSQAAFDATLAILLIRSWIADNGVEFELGEACLAHAVGNAVVQAYQRSSMLERRRPVMQAWAAFLFRARPEPRSYLSARAGSGHNSPVEQGPKTAGVIEWHKLTPLPGAQYHAGTVAGHCKGANGRWHRGISRLWLDLFDHWQTIIAGLARAGGGGVWDHQRDEVHSKRSNRRRDGRTQKGSVAAARDQIEVTAEQTATTIRLERERVLGAKTTHFAPCSKRRWRGSSPRRLGPERLIRTF